MRIAFVSRELYPLGGGGIGVQVAGACAALADVAEVTVVTSSSLEPAYRERIGAGEEVLPKGARIAFVEEPAPDEVGTFYGGSHLYSARVWDLLQELYSNGGPDLIEFSDFMGEGLVTIQARRGYHPTLRDTTVCVRLHTSAEICSILDGYIGADFASRMVVAGERHPLAEADVLLAPGAAVLETYEHVYGDALAPATFVAPVVPRDDSAPVAPPPVTDELRILYLGRLERRKGVQDLVRAFTGVRREDWRLTLVGGDTDTAPLGTSMRGVLELSSAGHPRVDFLDELPRDQLREVVDQHHVVVAPSRWECWPSTVLEALGRNRPVLVTPTGGMPEMVAAEDGAGWIADGVGERPLRKAIEDLLDGRERVATAIESGAPRRAHERLNDPGRLRAAYMELAADTRRPSVPKLASEDRLPLVSVVVPYHCLDRFVEDAVRSVFAQDHPAIEAIVVNDGSLRTDDLLLADLAERFPIRVLTQQNGGLSRARNAGIAQCGGRYVLPLDADNMLEPTFVSRCVEILENEPSVAFVTSWLRFVDPDGRALGDGDQGFQPIGNRGEAVLADNVAGDGTALFRRDIFDAGYRYSTDLASYEDWQLYRQLHRDGHFGLAIPERLIAYRVRTDSMIHEIGWANHHRIYGEMEAKVREGEVEWLCASNQTPAIP